MTITKLAASFTLGWILLFYTPAMSTEICMSPQMLVERNPGWVALDVMNAEEADTFTTILFDHTEHPSEPLKWISLTIYANPAQSYLVVQWFDKDGCATPEHMKIAPQIAGYVKAMMERALGR